LRITQDEIKRVARQLRRSADILEQTGPKAVQLAEDWSKSPLRAAGMDPGRGSGGHGDPTPQAAMSERYDSPGEQLTFLSSEVGRAYDAAVTAGERVLNIARVVVAENELKGIGWCACGNYADGKQRRLRNGQCPSCDQKERRETKALCDHKSKRRWSEGKTTCMACGVELTEAGTAAV
jgi:hypothetical protein